MTQKYFGARISDLLPRINTDIFIPSIQRPYVWEPEQIVKLFDSLMRGYPINTFMFWELTPEHLGDWEIYRFVSDFKHGDIHNEPAILSADKTTTLVLDGQQRLTSLLIGLMGSYTVRNGSRGRSAGWIRKILLLNLLDSPEDSDDEIDGTKVRELYYSFKFVTADRLPKNDATALWFPVSKIVQVTDRDQLAATVDRLLLLNPDLDESRQANLRHNLHRLWQVVHEEQTLAYYLEREQSYDKVLDIFIRANDGGTKLSKSDLLMSMITLRWDQFNARSETEAITYAMREKLDQESAFDRDYLLRAGLFFNDLDFAFQLRNFTPRNIAIIESTWPRVKCALLMATDLFARFGIRGGALTGVNAVMLIACYIYKVNAGRADTDWRIPPGDEARIRRWIGSVLFHGVLSGAANVTMEFYRRCLNEHLRAQAYFPGAELGTRMTTRGRDMTYDEAATGRFVAQEIKHRLGPLCLQLLYDRDDWSHKDWQVVQLVPSFRLLEDRLRVQGVQPEEIAVYQSWSMRLANHAILTDDEARDYYSVDFDDWVASRSPDFWAKHHLPSDPALYDEFNFLDFVGARKRLIGQRLGALLQEKEGDAPAVPEAQIVQEPVLTLSETAITHA